MANLFLEKLVSSIKEQADPAVLPVTFLCDLLSIGKEAAYRRLRGEIPFTFDEVVKISRRLEVSLDQIAEMSKSTSNSKWVISDMDILGFPSNYKDSYYENMTWFNKVLTEVRESNNAMLRCAGSIPHSFILRYKKLSLLRHYQSMFLAQDIGRDFPFEKMAVSPDWLDLENQLVDALQRVPRTSYIMNRTVFINLIGDINYFYRENLISETERQKLKVELLELLTYIETLTETGTYDTGAKIDIYLSGVDIDSSYAHFEYGTDEYAVNRVYFSYTLIYKNNAMCQKQKKWLELLKRLSTYITQTGERERIEFFNKQRELIESQL